MERYSAEDGNKQWQIKDIGKYFLAITASISYINNGTISYAPGTGSLIVFLRVHARVDDELGTAKMRRGEEDLCNFQCNACVES